MLMLLSNRDKDARPQCIPCLTLMYDIHKQIELVQKIQVKLAITVCHDKNVFMIVRTERCCIDLWMCVYNTILVLIYCMNCTPIHTLYKSRIGLKFCRVIWERMHCSCRICICFAVAGSILIISCCGQRGMYVSTPQDENFSNGATFAMVPFLMLILAELAHKS